MAKHCSCCLQPRDGAIVLLLAKVHRGSRSCCLKPAGVEHPLRIGDAAEGGVAHRLGGAVVGSRMCMNSTGSSVGLLSVRDD
mmetsp:Transcript_64782/g.156580  ORF Transcript_64782/g.156580 Transcript_64782/m.156580 type:complete len:82 (-) Transcript_64782:1863-2108(-)